MNTYIIRPRETIVERSIAVATVSMATEDRARQIARVIRLRAEDPIYRDIHRWIADRQPASAGTRTPIADTTAAAAGAPSTRQRKSDAKRRTRADGARDEPAVRDAPITGTVIVDLSDEDATRIRQELPTVLVLRDEPITLIPPRPVAATAKETLAASDLWHLEAIGLAGARERGFRGTGMGTVIAVLDTGIAPSHPELGGKVTRAVTFDTRPAVWAAQPMSLLIDTEGHGTHVAGLICGATVGVAPGARLLNGVMLPNGKGKLSDFILALEWASRQPEAQIVNMSAGIPGYVEELRAALADVRLVGILPVFAIGNEGRDRTRSPGNYAEAMSVGAADQRNGTYGVAGFSGGGTLIVDHHQYWVPDLVAPGKGVYSSVMGGGYEAWDGTSMATPIVSGVAALILEQRPTITVLDLEDELLSTCLDLGLPADRQGRGLVQVKAAL